MPLVLPCVQRDIKATAHIHHRYPVSTGSSSGETGMTKREAAIVTAYTGFLVGSMSGFHELAEELLDRPVWTHEFGSKEIMAEIKQAARQLYTSMEVD